MEGLKAATRWADGRGPETRITKIALEFLGLRDATELIGLVYNPQTTRDQLAKVAGIVFALAAEDSIAKNIVEESGRWLAELIQTVARKLEFREQGIKPMLGLAGGNFCNQPILLEATLRELARQNVAVEEAIRIYEPALGGFVLSTQKLLQQLEPTN
jgi:N-acetylglucosamine kinase-like BadF-type ATPase